MTELDRNNRISQEFQRISIYFENLPENKKSIVQPLIQNASFMKIALEDLQKIIAEQGPIESYQNGAHQHGTKVSAALQSYNALIKNFASVTKTLSDFLPPMERKMIAPSLQKFPRERTEEEWEEERQREAEHQRKLNEELARAAEMQRKQWEKEGRIKK